MQLASQRVFLLAPLRDLLYSQLRNHNRRTHTEGGIPMAKLRPLADRIVVKAVEREEMTSSGLVLPDTAKEKPQEGNVIAVGPGKLLDSGERAAIGVVGGGEILFGKYSGTEIKVDGEEIKILRESDILAKIIK